MARGMPSTAELPTPMLPLAFFQRLPEGVKPRLEIYPRTRDGRERHFYAQDVSAADVLPLLAPALSGLEAVVYRMPAPLLNPNYWEPYTREGEAKVREKMTGLVTRQEGEQTQLWRADAVAPGRLFRDGVDVEAELVLGYAFRVKGRDLPKLAATWDGQAGARDRFEWIAYSAIPGGEGLKDRVLQGHNDLTAFRFSVTESRIAFASSGDRRMRAIFSDPALQRKCIASAIRGYAMRTTGAVIAIPNDRVCDQLAAIGDGYGLSSSPAADFTDRFRTYEFKLHLGRTEWGLHPRAGADLNPSDAHVLLYYDRIAGIWAVAH